MEIMCPCLIVCRVSILVVMVTLSRIVYLGKRPRITSQNIQNIGTTRKRDLVNRLARRRRELVKIGAIRKGDLINTRIGKRRDIFNRRRDFVVLLFQS